jgi:hypothetical protein
MPFGFHLAMDTLPSGEPQAGGFRSALACFRLSLSCPFRLLQSGAELEAEVSYTPLEGGDCTALPNLLPAR